MAVRYDSNMMTNSNFNDGLSFMNEHNDNSYDSNLNNDVMKTMIAFLGKVDEMSNRLKMIEENQLKIIRKIEEGDVKVNREKDLKFEKDFREETLVEDRNGARNSKQEDFIEDIDKKNKETWAKRLFKNENRSQKGKIEVQGSVETEDKWSCAPVEFFICNTDVDTSEEDVKEAAKEIIKIDIAQNLDTTRTTRRHPWRNGEKPTPNAQG